MPIYDAIKQIKNMTPISEVDAETYLNSLPTHIQEQLISAIYIGRQHIHESKLLDDMDISRQYTSHMKREDFSRLISEKGVNVVTYLDKMEECALASKFDLNML